MLLFNSEVGHVFLSHSFITAEPSKEIFLPGGLLAASAHENNPLGCQMCDSKWNCKCQKSNHDYGPHSWKRGLKKQNNYWWGHSQKWFESCCLKSSPSSAIKTKRSDAAVQAAATHTRAPRPPGLGGEPRACPHFVPAVRICSINRLLPWGVPQRLVYLDDTEGLWH